MPWTFVHANNVNKYLPKSKENQKGQMRLQLQGLRSPRQRHLHTRQRTEKNMIAMAPLEAPPKMMMIVTYNPCNTICTDQTEKFTQTEKFAYA